VKGEDIAIGLGAFRNDVEGRVLGTPEHPVEAIDKWIQFLRGEIIDPAEIGDHAMPDFPDVVPEALNELQVAASAGLGDLGVLAGTISRVNTMNQEL